MPVAENSLRGVAGEAHPDGAGNMHALLFGRGSDSGHRLTAPRTDGCGVADDEDFRTPWRSEVGFHQRSSGVVGGQPRPSGGGRFANAFRPQYDLFRERPAAVDHALVAAFADGFLQLNFYAQSV